MLIYTIIRLLFISIITFFIATKPEVKEITYFSKQTWNAKETIPFYLGFALLALISFILYKNVSNYIVYQILTYVISLIAGLILLLSIKLIILKKKISIEVIGLKTSHIFWFIIFFIIQYLILIIFCISKFIQNYNLLIWSLIYFSTVLIIWPTIEVVFFLGMVFIPTSRKVGLLLAAVLISLLQSLYHFNLNAPALIINFLLVGILACYFYLKTKGILVPLLLHSSLNFFILFRDLISIST